MQPDKLNNQADQTMSKQPSNLFPETPDNSTGNTSGAKSSPKKTFTGKKIFLIIAVAVLAVIAGSAYYYAANKDKNTPSVPTAHLLGNAYTIPGSSDGRGITFNAQPGIKAWYDQKSDPHTKAYLRYVADPANAKSSIYVGRIAADSKDYQNGYPNKSFLENIRKSFLAEPSSATYQQSMNNLNDFAKWAYSDTNASFEFGAAAPFFNPFIKANAFVVGVTADADGSKLKQNQQGSMLWISGKKSYYHFLIMSDVTDWQKNQVFYQQVLQSVRIDQ